MKKILALILAAAMVMSLGACAQNETAATETKTAETVEPFTKEAGAKTETKTAESKADKVKTADAQADVKKADVKQADVKQADSKTADAGKAAEGAQGTAATEKPVLLHSIMKSGYQSAQYPDNRFAYTLTWGRLTLRDNETASYQELVKQLSVMGDKIKETVFADVDRFMETINEAKTNGRTDLQELVNETKVIAVRSDSNFFSARSTTYADYGGAHPGTVIGTYNFDSKTGKKLILGDILTDVAADRNKLTDIIKEDLLKNNKKEDFFDLDKDLAKYNCDLAETKTDDSQRAYTWLLGYDGIQIIFNQYDIAPYAAGMMTVNIRFKDHPELFKKGVELIPDSYAVQTDDSKDDKGYRTVSHDVKTKAGEFVWKIKYMDDDESRIFIYPAGSNTSAADIPGGDCQTVEQQTAEKAQEGLNTAQSEKTTEQIVDPYDFTVTAFERPAGKNITRHYTLDDAGMPVEK